MEVNAIPHRTRPDQEVLEDRNIVMINNEDKFRIDDMIYSIK